MSDKNRGLRVRLGAFVLLAVLLLGAMVVMFGSLPSWFRATTPYVVRFTEAPGLAPGAPVRRSGVKIGEVRRIALEEDTGIVRVELAIDRPFRIRRSEQATLVVGLLGSDASIDFVPKPAADGEPVDRDLIEPGAELVGLRAATVNTLLRGAGDVLPSTQETLADIRKSIQRLEKLAARAERTIPLVEETLREYRDLAKQGRATVPEIQKTNSEIRELARAYREAVPDARRAIEEYNGLARDARAAFPEFRKTNRDIQEAVRSARELFPTAEATMEEIRQLSRDVRDLVGDVRKMVPTVRAGIEDVAAASRQAQRFLENADRLLIENREQVKRAMEQLNKTLDQSLKLLSDENINKFSTILTNASSASEPLPRITRNLDAVLADARITVKRLNETLAKIDGSLTDVTRLTRPLGDRSAAISRNLDESLQKINDSLTDVRSLMKAIDRADGVVRKLLTDPTLYNNIDRVVIAVMKLVPELGLILKNVEVFTDKIARHPSRLGIGGAIRPEPGLKGPPTPPLMPNR